MSLMSNIILFCLLFLAGCVSKEAAEGLSPQALGGGGGGVVQVLGPSLSLISGNQNFSSTNVGSSSTLTVTVANTGSDTANISAPSLIGNDVVVTTDLCGTRTLPPGQTCSIIGA